MNRDGRVPRCMWRQDCWAEGTRLFAKTIGGKSLSVHEGARQFDCHDPDRGAVVMNATQGILPLEHGCGSWIVTDRETGRAVVELFDDRRRDECVSPCSGASGWIRPWRAPLHP